MLQLLFVLIVFSVFAQNICVICSKEITQMLQRPNLRRMQVSRFVLFTFNVTCRCGTFYSVSFYPLDAMLERVLGTATCLSVWLSVTAGIVSKRKQLAS